jgi:kynureninase
LRKLLIPKEEQNIQCNEDPRQCALEWNVHATCVTHRGHVDDSSDRLQSFREKYFIPHVNGKGALYFTGNSLGLQPKSVLSALQTELEDWKNLGVEGHFHGKNPWFHYHKFLTNGAALVVGAKPIEVVVMNQLTSNLHFLFVSFYRPTKQRFKIIAHGLHG